MSENKMSIDQQIAAVEAKIQKQKEIVLETEKKSNRSWSTTCQLNLSQNFKVNIQSAKEDTLREALAQLLIIEDYSNKASKMLNLKNEFKFDGYSVAEWVSDMESRIAKIKLKTEKEKLEKLQLRIESITSEDQKRQRELQRIIDELEGDD